VYGDLLSLLTILKGLPMSYNRDLQEDKEPVFDAADTVRQMLEVLPPMLTAIIFRVDRMRAATADGFLNATDLADYLVTKGVPFREAHEIVGRIVRQCVEAGERLESLPLTRLRQFSQAFGPDVAKQITLDACVERRQSAGGTSSRRVAEAIQAAKRTLRRP
jgi:argininosuccinate lyase